MCLPGGSQPRVRTLTSTSWKLVLALFLHTNTVIPTRNLWCGTKNLCCLRPSSFPRDSDCYTQFFLLETFIALVINLTSPPLLPGFLFVFAPSIKACRTLSFLPHTFVPPLQAQERLFCVSQCLFHRLSGKGTSVIVPYFVPISTTAPFLSLWSSCCTDRELEEEETADCSSPLCLGLDRAAGEAEESCILPSFSSTFHGQRKEAAPPGGPFYSLLGVRCVCTSAAQGSVERAFLCVTAPEAPATAASSGSIPPVRATDTAHLIPASAPPPPPPLRRWHVHVAVVVQCSGGGASLDREVGEVVEEGS